MLQQNVRCDLNSDFETISEDEAFALSDLYKMFADPSRIKILCLLQGREICVNHIAEQLEMTISAVSHQLRLLRASGLVRYIKEGKRSYYALDDDHVSAIIEIARQHIDHR